MFIRDVLPFAHLIFRARQETYRLFLLRFGDLLSRRALRILRQRRSYGSLEGKFAMLLLHLAALSIFSFASSSCDRTQPSTTLPLAASMESALLTSLDQSTDDALTLARRLDASGRDSTGSLAALTAAEHMRRATLYNRNRLFPQAREHWEALISRYPVDAQIPAALFGVGRAFYQERRFAEALPYFERLGREYTATPDGREGFYYIAPTLLRMNRATDAARQYESYIARFPQGERIENAHLNLIDTLREASLPTEAIVWIARTRTRFPRTPVDQNALFARLRLEIAEGKWTDAAKTADELRRESLRPGVGTSSMELAFLRAYSLERAKRTSEAIAAYAAIPDTLGSYYGGRATARLMNLGAAGKRLAAERTARVRLTSRQSLGQYPAPFRTEIINSVKGRAVDPRFILAVMRQESGFRPAVKSQAAARGLMQMTVDTAAKYAPRVGLRSVTESELYAPDTSILLASEYIAELNRMFPNLPEAVAASYNGGEDNAARWVQRAGRAATEEPGIFTAEVGFSETKDYVIKVLANYRAYQELYTNNLQPLAR